MESGGISILFKIYAGIEDYIIKHLSFEWFYQPGSSCEMLTKIKGDFRLTIRFSGMKVWSFMPWFTESLTALRKPISDLSWPDTKRNNKRSKLAAQCVKEHPHSILDMTLFEKSTMIIPAWPFWCDSVKKSAKFSRRAGQRCWLAELWRTWGEKNWRENVLEQPQIHTGNYQHQMWLCNKSKLILLQQKQQQLSSNGSDITSDGSRDDNCNNVFLWQLGRSHHLLGLDRIYRFVLFDSRTLKVLSWTSLHKAKGNL